jgi:hypothetical protein
MVNLRLSTLQSGIGQSWEAGRELTSARNADEREALCREGRIPADPNSCSSAQGASIVQPASPLACFHHPSYQGPLLQYSAYSRCITSATFVIAATVFPYDFNDRIAGDGLLDWRG